MAIALGANHTTAAAASSPATSAIDTSGYSLLVAVDSAFVGGGALNAITTSSPSNTLTAATQYGTAGAGVVRINYKVNPSVGASQTCTQSQTSVFEALLFGGFTGVDTSSPFDIEDGATRATSVTSIQANTGVVPSVNDVVVIAALVHESAISNLAIGSGFTIIDQVGYSAGVNDGGAWAYKVITGGAGVNVNPQWSWTTAANATCSLAVFKPAAGGPAARPFWTTIGARRVA